jgi:hypothetical protein
LIYCFPAGRFSDQYITKDCIMADGNNNKRRWLRFSLATFLFVCLCIGGSIAGYQSGYRRGYNSGASTRDDEMQSVQTYDISFLIWPDLPASDRETGIKELVDLIKSTISSDIWDEQSGNEIREYPTNNSLVITAPGSVHREIRDRFKQLEDSQTRGMAKQIMPAMQAMASKGKSHDWPLDVKAPKNSQMAGIWLEKYYDATVSGISKRWGAPRYQGKCTNTGFPDWSLDQQIATWRRGSGLSYLALRFAKDGHLQIVAGWRENS